MWILFASLNPLSESLRSILVKRASDKVDPILISWSNYFFPFIIFTPALFFIEPKFDLIFLGAFLTTAIINVAASILYMRAISMGDISSVMPMLSFTPLFLLLTSPIIVGEFPDIFGLIGIILIVTGSYLLNSNLRKEGIFAPFKSLLKNKGTRYMFFVSFLWSVSANFDKVSINHSSVAQHLIFLNIFLFLSFTIIISIQGKLQPSIIRKGGGNLFLVSLFTFSSMVFHMTAISMTLVAYVVALKRMSGPLSVIWGNLFFNEPNLRERLLGSILMFIGVLLIVL